MFKKIWPKIKESFQTAIVAAFIILIVIILLYIPFKIIPQMMSKGTSFIATTLSSFFIPNEDNEEERKEKEDKDEQPASKTPSIPKYYGNADLSIELIGTGFVDERTGILYYSNEVGKDNIVGVRFQVKNIGTNISKQWRLKLIMPSKTTPEHISDYQISLKPGDRIEYTASFENPTKTGILNGYIIADYTNNVIESSKTNNYLNIPFTINNNKVTINNYSNTIKISCGVSNTNPKIGEVVTWYATVNSGYGQLLYSWQGSEGLFSMGSTANGIKKIYNTSGTKTAKVIINYNNQTYSKDCESIRVR